jgi:uncharacterized protein YhfF
VTTADPVEDFWARFVAATGIDGPHSAWAFGGDDTPELATKLAQLVRWGPKRATASLVEEYEDDDEPLPQVGELSVVLDGAGEPVCVIRTSDVTVARFGDVDERFAWDEGEGDRSLAWWRDAHLSFWDREGRDVDDDTPVVLERFELLWPTDPPA